MQPAWMMALGKTIHLWCILMAVVNVVMCWDARCGVRDLLLVRSGNVVGRGRGNLTVGPCEWVAGGESLERSASPGWACSQEG